MASFTRQTENGRRKTVIKKPLSNQNKMYEGITTVPQDVKVWKVPDSILDSIKFKPRRKLLRCSVCPVHRDFVYEQSHFMDDWGRLKVRKNVCTNCIGIIDQTTGWY